MGLSDGRRRAGLDDDLSPELAEFARSIAPYLEPEPTDPATQQRVRARLTGALRAEAVAAYAAQRRRVAMLSRAAWSGLAAAVVVVAIISVQGATRRTTPVSAYDILGRAEGAAIHPAAFRSYVVTEVTELRQDPAQGGLVRVESTRWYERPGRWRRESVTTVLDSAGRPLAQNGLTSVSDGVTLWIHRLRDNTVLTRPLAEQPRADELGPFPEVTGGLSALLAQVRACYSPGAIASDVVAGRAVYVIALGASRCTPDALLDGGALAGTPLVEWTISVDKVTSLILRSVQSIDGEVVASTIATSVAYDIPVASERFQFTPPANARLRDLTSPVRPTPTSVPIPTPNRP